MVAVIGSKPRPKGEVSAAVTASVPAELAPWCPGCKVHHPSESVFRAAPLLGRLVLTSTAPVLLAKAKTWLGANAEGDIDVLRTVLRHYLHCYAPTTSGHFAEWAGITNSDAKERWRAVSDALVPVQGERKGFVLEEDLDALEQSPASPACACSRPRTRSSRRETATSSSPIRSTARPCSRVWAGPASRCTRPSR